MSDMELPGAAQIAALPSDGGDEFNRLVFETSPYLLQHCQNPVDWRPWGPEAFAEARERDCPIFLSVGYSTCHWCHVMERESFERDEVAAVLNAHFVPVKVDREERPDLDEIYMAATQMLTGRGGWPMSVWLTPDAEPFFAGTYYPREDRVVGRHPVDGPVVQPGFITLLKRLSGFWVTQRDEALERARDLSDAVRQHCQQAGGEGGAALSGRLDSAVDELEAAFDPEHGGFGGTPKFPPHGSLRLLLHLLEGGDARGRESVSRTLDAMAQGGVHDHVGGGFHRYSTDERWFLPHFEKMLYDNAQLGRAYVDGWRLLEEPRHRLVAQRLYDWVLREMVDEAGGFTSALDADSEGEEGTFYVWKPQEIVDILGADRGAAFCEIYGVSHGGNWRDEASGEVMSTSIPHLSSPVELEAWREQIPALEALYERRVARIWPHHDDKVLTSWNGLMIASMAYAGAQLDRPDYLAAAERAARFARETLWIDGRLLATYRAGTARLSAYLDDHAFLADGLLELHAATGSDEWLAFARALVDVLLERFGHPDGGFYFTADDHEDLLVRSRSGIDRAIPSGNGVAARVLYRLGELTGDPRYGEVARKTVEAFSGLMNRYSRATESLLLASAMMGAESAEPGAEGVVREGPVTMRLLRADPSAPAGAGIKLTVEVTIDPGCHIQSNKPSEEHLIATELLLSDSEVGRLDEVVYPVAHEVLVGDTQLALFSGTFHISARLQPPDTAGVAVSGELSLRHQACDAHACQAPATLRLPLSLMAT